MKKIVSAELEGLRGKSNPTNIGSANLYVENDIDEALIQALEKLMKKRQSIRAYILDEINYDYKLGFDDDGDWINVNDIKEIFKIKEEINNGKKKRSSY